MDYFLAIDIGASSGRHILGWIEGDVLKTEEIYRFSNKHVYINSHYYWQQAYIFQEILMGLRKCKELNKIPKSIGINTWGVDYALIDEADHLIGGVFSYRDDRTNEAITAIDELISRDTLYEKTGIQFQKFNTIYQLYADKLTEKIEQASAFLMVPDFFNFLLTGVKKNEYTNATTTGLVNLKTKNWDYEIIEKLKLPKKIFSDLAYPGEVVGSFTKEIEDVVGFNSTVVLVATHDTASAVMSLVASEKNPLYISSGTWSLMGILTDQAKTDGLTQELNYTNEGSDNGKYRLQKNIMGLWIIQKILDESSEKYSFHEITDDAKKCSDFQSLINVNDERFLNPEYMVEEIYQYYIDTNQEVPKSEIQIYYSVYRSLAVSYQKTALELESLTDEKKDNIYIVGGGCQNEFLAQLTANLTKKTVICGPVEASAIGNLLVQLIIDKKVMDEKQGRQLIKKSFPIKTFK